MTITTNRAIFERPSFDQVLDVKGQVWTVLLLRNHDALYDQLADPTRGVGEVATPGYGLLGDISFLVRAVLFALTRPSKRTWRLVACPIPRGLIGSSQQAVVIETFDSESEAVRRAPGLIEWLEGGAGHGLPRFSALRYPGSDTQ